MERVIKRIVPVRVLYTLLNIWLYIDKREHFAATGYIFYGNEVLLVKQSYGEDVWTFPGGFIKSDERPEDGLRREVCEEVGLELRDVMPIAAMQDTRPRKNVTVHHFYARTKTKQCIIDPVEIKEARWVPIGDLDKMQIGNTSIFSRAIEFHKTYARD